MTVYDQANVLAQALKESQEYLKVKASKEVLNANPEHAVLAKDFSKTQMTIQTRQMLGQTLTDEEIQAFNAKTAEILAYPDIAAYFQAQMAFTMMLQNIMKTISEAVDLDLSMFNPTH